MSKGIPKRTTKPYNDHEYFHELMFLFERLSEPKFMAGVREHRSHIWDLSDEQLELMELEELIDMVMYRLTKIMKRQK